MAVAEFEAAIRSAVTPVVKTSSEAAVSKEEEPSVAPVKEAKAVSVKVPEKEEELIEIWKKAVAAAPSNIERDGQVSYDYNVG